MSHMFGPASVAVDHQVHRGQFSPHDHPLWENDRASEWLGVTITEYAPGYAKGQMRIREEMLNGFDIAHGGMVFAFADTIFAWTCNDPNGDGSSITVAQGVDVNFLASAAAGTTLIGVGHMRASAGRSGLCDITIHDDRGILIAEFRGRHRTIPNPRH